jgi:hypothetical protein|tara:strand:+ start:1102 stop:1359 length:258 start_codon:yes stop_codon:yes gene_type:complete
MTWFNIIKQQMTDGQRAFLYYMTEYHGKEYAMDMYIHEMTPEEVFMSLQEEMEVNDWEATDLSKEMNKKIVSIMKEHYKSYYDMR